MNKTCADCALRPACANADYLVNHKYPLTSMTCQSWETVKKPTNGDRLRAWSDEELTKFLSDSTASCTFCSYRNIDCNAENKTCLDGVAEWLKQEAEDV